MAPGYTDTEGNQRIGFVGSAAADAMVAATPLGGRFGKPEEIAPAVIFLASDDAAWLTGERINASGGVHEDTMLAAGRKVTGTLRPEPQQTAGRGRSGRVAVRCLALCQDASKAL